MGKRDAAEGVDRKTIINSMDDGPINGKEGRNYRRRSFIGKALAAMGSTLATTIGISATASATTLPHAEKAKAAAREYASEPRIRKVIDVHAADMITALAREGYIERDALSSFPLETIHESIRSYVDSDEGVLVTARAPDGYPSVKIQVKRRLSREEELILIVNPETGASRTVVRRLDPQDHSTVLTTTLDSDGQVTTQNCSYCDSRTECSRSCGPYSCGCEKVEARVCWDDSDCDGCYTVDYSCCGDYDCNL